MRLTTAQKRYIFECLEKNILIEGFDDEVLPAVRAIIKQMDRMLETGPRGMSKEDILFHLTTIIANNNETHENDIMSMRAPQTDLALDLIGNWYKINPNILMANITKRQAEVHGNIEQERELSVPKSAADWLRRGVARPMGMPIHQGKIPSKEPSIDTQLRPGFKVGDTVSDLRDTITGEVRAIDKSIAPTTHMVTWEDGESEWVNPEDLKKVGPEPRRGRGRW